MRTIIPAASIVDEVVGKQKRVAGQDYRLMTYVLQCPVDDGVLLYHTLTCCMVLLTHEEVAHLTELQELVDHALVIQEDQVEQKAECSG